MKHKLLNFIYRLGEFKIRVGLANTHKLMQLLGNPEKQPGMIHFAGTNGKGSVLTFLEKFLIDSGFTVCATTSPHLLSYNERFRFQGKSITDEELALVFTEICKRCKINPLAKNTKSWLVEPTFFEFSIGLAFYWFQKKKPDFILLETGMGGRLDSTNVIQANLASILTPISLDHSEFLGETIQQIALEKFGIIKKNSLIISSYQEPSVLELLEKNYPENSKNILGKDFFLEKKDNNFYFKKKLSTTNQNKNLKICFTNPSQKADYQLENMAVALNSYFAVVPPQKWLPVKKLNSSFQKHHWPARMQYFNSLQPKLLLEAAHNSQGIEILQKHLLQYHPKDKIICAIHWLQKKDLSAVLTKFSSLNIEFIPILFAHSKASNSTEIYKVLKDNQLKTNLPQAMDKLISNYLEKKLVSYSLLLVTGSIYFIGAFYKQLTTQSTLFTNNKLYGF